MAEAMCGPSNALQQVKQQTDVDRSLHQDRIAARHHPTQSFRSPNPHAGALNPEFEAFQAGHDFSLPDHVQSFQRSAAPLQAPSWATDFQRMQISHPPPLQQQQFQQTPSTPWAQGFRERVTQSAPRAQTSASSPLAFQQRARYGLSGFQSQYSQTAYASATVLQANGKAPVMEQFDEAAFAAAFDQARDDMMTEAEESLEEEATARELIDEMDAEKFEAIVEQAATEMLQDAGHDLDIEEYTPLSKVHSGGDIEHQPMTRLQEERQQERNTQHDDDALAATAEELLEKVKHNQSDKFRNSQFLGLMRKLRDREVRVEGDKMVETEKNSSTSTADTTLNASSTNYSQQTYYGKPQPAPLPVDTRPPDYGIPTNEQDHDLGRVDPRDGQEVVDMLSSGAPLTDDMAYDPSYAESYASASPEWAPF